MLLLPPTGSHHMDSYLHCSHCRLKPIFHCDAKPFALGPGVGLDPPMPQFHIGYTNQYIKTLKFALPPTPNLNFVSHRKRTPNASQWNIGCVGSPGFGAGIGHLDFMLLCSFHLRWLPNANPICSGIWVVRFVTAELLGIMCWTHGDGSIFYNLISLYLSN